MSISERAAATVQPPKLSRIVTEAEVEKALDFLRDSAAQLGQIREEAIKADRYVDHVEAIKTLASDETSDSKRRADARSSQEWLSAVDEAARWAGELEKLRALRTAAEAKIEAWRTESATYRGMKI